MRWTDEDWKPKRRGKFYCSQACGGGTHCLWADYQGAKKSAVALAKQLGNGWTPRIWENLGWHFEVVSPCRRIRIHACKNARHTEYVALLSTPVPHARAYGRLFIGVGKTPTAAINQIRKQGRAYIKQLQTMLEGII